MSPNPDGFLSTKRIEHGTWRAMERSVGRLFTHMGWSHVALVGGPEEHGADVISSSEDRELVAQVRFKSSPDRPARKKIVDDVKLAMEFYDATEGLCVTNTRLSESADTRRTGLIEEGYDIKKLEGNALVDKYDALPRWPANDFEPYEYQRSPIERLLELYDDGYERALLSLATGLGKTFVAGRFLRQLLRRSPKTRVLVLADQRPLVRQFQESLWPHLPKDVATHLWYASESPAFDSGSQKTKPRSMISSS
jgi:predicted helicase